MSGTGQKNAQAPTRLTPIAVDQPVAQDRSGGTVVFPTPYFAQVIQRILSYLGQPGTSTGTGGQSGGNTLTVSEQLTNLNNTVEILQTLSGNGAPSAGIVGRVAALEAAVRQLVHRTPPPPPRPPYVPPLPPPFHSLTAAQILSWWRGA